MFKLLLVIHSLIAASLVGVILMQRSEGGGLAGGGSPAGLLSARGAGDFLTRTTAILATLFILLSIVLAGFATVNRRPTQLDDSLKKEAPAAALPGIPGLGGQAGQAPATPGEAPTPATAGGLPAVATPTTSQASRPQLSEEQILNLSPDQLKKLDPAQFQQLSPEQRQRVANEWERRNKLTKAREQEAQRSAAPPAVERKTVAVPKPQAAAPVKLPPITAPAPKLEIPAQAPAAVPVQGPPVSETPKP